MERGMTENEENSLEDELDDEYEEDEEIDPLEPGVTYRRSSPKVGRNDPCPCGSGKKYKKCHGL